MKPTGTPSSPKPPLKNGPPPLPAKPKELQGNPLNSSSSQLSSSTPQTQSPSSTSLDEIPRKEGFLTKKGGVRHNWKRRWFVLSPQSIDYYTESGEKVQYYIFK